MTGNAKTLRKGWTTGACAAAAAKAAFQGLLTGAIPRAARVALPRGQTPEFVIHRSALAGDRAEASIVKDAGDDPDVTHGVEIVSSVTRRGKDGRGLKFLAGPGVGTVTKPGLQLPVGEPAINPKPRAYIRSVLESVARRLGASLDIDLEISIVGGEELAKRTLNGRLGIVGGLSILGTTGVVVPYSCSSWIHSIHRAVDVARAAGFDHVAAATGSTSEAAVRKLLGLEETQLIEMGDFAGGLLKYLRKSPVPRLTLAGGFAKMAKLAQGAMSLHSGQSRVDFDNLAATLGDLGADPKLADKAKTANSAMEVLTMAEGAGLPLGDAVAVRARARALATLSGGVRVDVYLFDRRGRVVGKAKTEKP